MKRCNKTKYGTEFFAEEQCKTFNRTKKKDNPIVLYHYFCEECKTWHITKQKPKDAGKITDLKLKNKEIQELKQQIKALTKQNNILVYNEIPKLNKTIRKLQDEKT